MQADGSTKVCTAGDARKQGCCRRHLPSAQLHCGLQCRNPFEASLRYDGTLGFRRPQAHDRQHRAWGIYTESQQGYPAAFTAVYKIGVCFESFKARSHVNSQYQKECPTFIPGFFRLAAAV